MIIEIDNPITQESFNKGARDIIAWYRSRHPSDYFNQMDLELVISQQLEQFYWAGCNEEFKKPWMEKETLEYGE
jgi:hypothetical protein